MANPKSYEEFCIKVGQYAKTETDGLNKWLYINFLDKWHDYSPKIAAREWDKVGDHEKQEYYRKTRK